MNNFTKYFPFTKPRSGQFELIDKIITAFNNGKKHVILNAPTGWGKSVIAYTIMKYYKSGYILTSQKCLQEQYYNDLQIPYVMGRSNYKCAKNSVLTCEFGVCKNLPEHQCNQCPYKAARTAAIVADVSNFNYNYFLTVNVYCSSTDETGTVQYAIPHRSVLVCDEAHGLENELLKLCSLKLSEKLLKFLGIFVSMPSKSSDDEDKFAWLFNKIYPKLKEQEHYFKTQILTFKSFKISKEYKQTILKYSAVTRLVSLLVELEKQYNTKSKIIINYDEDIIEYKLLYANNLFKQYIENTADYILHMSATILSKDEYCKSLGLNPNNVEYIQAESFFPVEHRLIYYDPVGSLSYNKKFETMPKLIKKVGILLEKYKDFKGIIHTGNYNIANILIDQLSDTQQGQRLIMPRGENRQDLLNTFYKSLAPLVLISPSLTEGLDLKDDLSRFCIICKVPYANLKDPWTKARMTLSNLWYLNNTAQIMLQMTGRSIRSETDYCDTYILDEDFLPFAQRALDIFPNWWKASVKTVISD